MLTIDNMLPNPPCSDPKLFENLRGMMFETPKPKTQKHVLENAQNAAMIKCRKHDKEKGIKKARPDWLSVYF